MPRKGCSIQFPDGDELRIFIDGLSLYRGGNLVAYLRFDQPSQETCDWWLDELEECVRYLRALDDG